MDWFMEDPILYGGILLGVILVPVIVVSVVISNKRKKEVEELDRLFPEGSLAGEAMKIPVEKVRRTTMEREKRKKQRTHIPRERPKEGEKALPDEDQEIIIRSDESHTDLSRPEKASRAEKQERSPSSRKDRLRARKVDDGGRAGEKQEKEELEKTFAVRTTTRKAKGEKQADDPAADEKGGVDAATSRRLYKKSLLKPERGDGGEMGDTKPRTLINPQMFTGDEHEGAGAEPEEPKRRSGRNWFGR